MAPKQPKKDDQSKKQEQERKEAKKVEEEAAKREQEAANREQEAAEAAKREQEAAKREQEAQAKKNEEAKSSGEHQSDLSRGQGGEVPAAKRPRLEPGVELSRPELPADSNTPEGSPGARGIMRAVIPWVLQELPKAMMRILKQADEVDMVDVEPLAIATGIAESSGVAVTSYKEKWNPRNCLLACQDSGMYEAAGNGTWLDPEVAGDSTDLPSEDPAWHWVKDKVNSMLVETDIGGRRRIKFPVNLSCYRRQGLKSLSHQYPRGGLVPLAGHGFIYLWYLAVYKALSVPETAANDRRLLMLYECILSVTITMYVTTDRAKLALESNRMSETVRSAQRVSVDNFVTFAQKVQLISNKKMDIKQLMRQEVQFNGGLINATMVKTIQQMSILDEHARRLLRILDREFGHEVLTGSYNKLKAFCAAAKTSEGACFILESQLVALRRNEVTAADFLLSAYSKGSNGKNFMQVAMANRCMVKHLKSIMDGVKAVDPDLGEKMQVLVFDKLDSPLGYNKTFPVEADDVEDDNYSEHSSGVPVKEETSEFMAKLSENNPKGIVLFAEMLKKVYDGEYSDAHTVLIASSTPEEVLHQMDEQQLGTYVTELKECMKCLRAAESVLSGSTTKAPQPSLRELARQASDTADAETARNERADVWKRAVAQRKKLVTLSLVKNPRAKASYVSCVARVPGIKEFKGQTTGKEHRVFVMSVDLIHQEGKQPWLEHSPPEDKIFQEMQEFLMGEARGPSDVIVAWDGCQRSARRQIEDTIGTLPKASEVFIVYKTAWNGWVKRRHFLCSETTEVGYITMPVSRNKVALKARESGHNAAGEINSHWQTFSGVEPPSRLSLARLSAEDKAKVFPKTPGPLPEKWAKAVPAGVPMFWSETKSDFFWETLLQELGGGCVVDLTPGSGLLASACMSLGILYLGLVGSPNYLTWLSNVVDRQSLKYICRGGNFLYQEDLAKVVEELFADAVEDTETLDEEITHTDTENSQ